jgi:hypothetical protein
VWSDFTCAEGRDARPDRQPVYHMGIAPIVHVMCVTLTLVHGRVSPVSGHFAKIPVARYRPIRQVVVGAGPQTSYSSKTPACEVTVHEQVVWRTRSGLLSPVPSVPSTRITSPKPEPRARRRRIPADHGLMRSGWTCARFPWHPGQARFALVLPPRPPLSGTFFRSAVEVPRRNLLNSRRIVLTACPYETYGIRKTA